MQDNSSLIVATFADVKVPEFKETPGSDWIRFGENDDYPDYLISLLRKSAKHGSIVGSKATYILGGGLQVDDADPKAVQFKVKHAALIEKLNTDVEAFGMCYVQAIPTRDKTGFVFHHMSHKKVRSNVDNTKFFFSKNFKDRRFTVKEFPAFDPAKKVNSVLVYKEYTPGLDTYGLPGFVASINWIEADIEVSKATLTNAKGGFSATKFVNFYNGQPIEAVKRSIVGRFNTQFTGSEGERVIVGFNDDPAKAPTVDDLGTSDLTKEDFQQVDTLISTNIYAGHRITIPSLFGIPKTAASLGNDSGNELKMAFDIFCKTYVAGKKAKLETLIQTMAFANGITSKIGLIDVEPVGYSFTEATLLKVAPRSWLLEQLGIDVTKYTDAAVEGPAPSAVTIQNAPPAVAQQHEAPKPNEILRGLSATEHRQAMRVIREYMKTKETGKGQMTRDLAKIMLASYGLTTEQMDAILPEDEAVEAFGNDEDVAALFASHGEPRANYETFQRKLCTFANDTEYTDLEDKIKAAKAANPKATAKTIAKELNVEEAVVSDYLKGNGVGGVAVKLPKFEVRYSYEKRPDVAGPEVIPTTRPFCRKMLALDKLYTRADIQKISQYLGYDVMKRAGGFWNNDGQTEYHCRHEFFSQIVIKRK